jgi:hypothetical protein
VKYDDAVIRPVAHFAGTRDHAVPTDRLRHVRRQAHAFREEMLSGPTVRYFRSFDLVKVPYPSKYALRDACTLPTPYVHILNRLFVVQFDSVDGVKTLLAEPLDRIGNARTPFFARLAKPLGGAEGRAARTFWPALGDVETILERIGLRPEDIDYITYDHLHTQDPASGSDAIRSSPTRSCSSRARSGRRRPDHCPSMPSGTAPMVSRA